MSPTSSQKAIRRLQREVSWKSRKWIISARSIFPALLLGLSSLHYPAGDLRGSWLFSIPSCKLGGRVILKRRKTVFTFLTFSWNRHHFDTKTDWRWWVSKRCLLYESSPVGGCSFPSKVQTGLSISILGHHFLSKGWEPRDRGTFIKLDGGW